MYNDYDAAPTCTLLLHLSRQSTATVTPCILSMQYLNHTNCCQCCSCSIYYHKWCFNFTCCVAWERQTPKTT